MKKNSQTLQTPASPTPSSSSTPAAVVTATTVAPPTPTASSSKRSWQKLEPKHPLISGRHFFVNKFVYSDLKKLSRQGYNHQYKNQLKKCRRMDNALITADDKCSKIIYSLLNHRNLNKENEVWDHGSIRNYLENTFKRVAEQGKILGGFVENEGNEPQLRVVIWHTGLQTGNLEDIYCVLARNMAYTPQLSEEEVSEEVSDFDDAVSYASSNQEAMEDGEFEREFKLVEFLTGPDITQEFKSYKFWSTIEDVWLNGLKLTSEEKTKMFTEAYGQIRSAGLPKQASYFATSLPEQIVFCPELTVDFNNVNISHLIENKKRLPEEYQSMDDIELSFKLKSAAEFATLRAKSNPRLAIPQFYKPKGIMDSSMQLLLPINIAKPTSLIPDAALVLRVNSSTPTHKVYEIVTVLDLHKAYGNARVVCKIDQEWLRHNTVDKKKSRQSSSTSAPSSATVSSTSTATPVLGAAVSEAREPGPATTIAPEEGEKEPEKKSPVRSGKVVDIGKGYGYIEDSETRERVYYSVFNDVKGKWPNLQETVSFELAWDERQQKKRAVNIVVTSAAVFSRGRGRGRGRGAPGRGASGRGFNN